MPAGNVQILDFKLHRRHLPDRRDHVVVLLNSVGALGDQPAVVQHVNAVDPSPRPCDADEQNGQVIGSRMPRISSVSSADSAGFMPAAGSSSGGVAGCVANAGDFQLALRRRAGC